MAVASFTVLAQPTVAQGTNATLPLTPSGVCQLLMWLRNGILSMSLTLNLALPAVNIVKRRQPGSHINI